MKAAIKTNGRTVVNVPVWLTEHDDPAGLLPGSKDPDFIRASTLSFSDMRSHGWTRIGAATVTVELIAEKEMVANKVQSLQAQLQQERATCEVKCNRILEQISRLQALEYTA